jgi:import inner membrane translocase subunit TIM21
MIANLQQGGVIYVLYTYVFSPDSVTSHFNRAVDQVKRDEKCIELLGNSKKITAYGEPTFNKWAKVRPIAYVFLTLFSTLSSSEPALSY